MTLSNWINPILLLFFAGFSPSGYAQTYLTVEAGMIWQSRNDQRIPGDSGTEFSISDLDAGPFAGYRVYAGHLWNKRHEVRALYAPLAIEVSGTFDQTVDFQNASFAANTETTAFYKFNSYRLTYAYHFDRMSRWLLALGFTAKVRDAEVRLEQAGLSRRKSNVGVVPLLNFQARYDLTEGWHFRFDFDGLAAPQGRAVDAAFFLERHFDLIHVFGGYRTIEGGADNDKVYNFAWIHQGILGARYDY